MFAPKVASPQTKAVENPTGTLTPQRSTPLGHRLGQHPVGRIPFRHRTIGNQATLRRLAPQQTPYPNRSGDHQQDGISKKAPLPGAIQAKLVVGEADDPLEHEADHVADLVMRMLNPTLSVAAAPPQISRKCAACEADEDKPLRKPAAQAVSLRPEAPDLVRTALGATGRPLDAAERSYFEPRFGHDFSAVRLHTDEGAAASATAIGALAYTLGSDIAFAAGQYQPATPSGRRLIAHELTHVVQQGSTVRRAPQVIRRQTCAPADSAAAPAGLTLSGFEQGSPVLPGADYAPLLELAKTLAAGDAGKPVALHGFASQEGDTNFNVSLSCQRAWGVEQVLQANDVRNPLSLFAHGATTSLGKTESDNRAVIVSQIAPSQKVDEQQQPTDKPAQDAQRSPGSSCAPSSKCQPEFCSPFPTEAEARADRDLNGESVLQSLPNSKVVPLYREFIAGGGPNRDISATFGKDFTESLDTIAATQALQTSVEAAIRSSPPAFPPGANAVTLDLHDVLKDNLHALARKTLLFSNITEAPFLLAGGVATDAGQEQTRCHIGATPSNQDDDRRAEGTVTVTRNADGSVSIAPVTVTYTVIDTLDFCPGACGGPQAQKLTVPLSRWEASLISGDVPFTVRFSAPVGSAGSEE